MIYSQSRNFLFLRVPKTASTSINFQILDSIPRCEITAQTSINVDGRMIHSIGAVRTMHPNYHPNLNELIEMKLIHEETLVHLNVYGVIRDPIDRIISCAQHFYNRFRKKDEIVSNDVAVQKLLFDKQLITAPEKFILDKPQSHWLIHNNQLINKIYRYDQINNLIQDICGINSINYNLRSQYRKQKTIDLSSELQQECRARFQQDFDLWESLSRGLT